MYPVAILAGGLATRLHPLTERVPKSLIEVGGRPFALHQLEQLARSGVREVVFCVGFMGELLEAEIGDGRQLGMRIRYSYDGAMLLGTGGAVKKALPLLGSSFFVLYGDSYLRVDYATVQAAHQKAKCPAVMTVFRNEGRWDRSNVRFQHGKILAYDKRNPSPEMQHVDYGLGVLTREAFEPFTAGTAFDLSEVYERLVQKAQLAAFEVTERFYEIGSPAGLAELSNLLAKDNG